MMKITDEKTLKVDPLKMMMMTDKRTLKLDTLPFENDDDDR